MGDKIEVQAVGESVELRIPHGSTRCLTPEEALELASELMAAAIEGNRVHGERFEASFKAAVDKAIGASGAT